jgi:hypothetical protein
MHKIVAGVTLLVAAGLVAGQGPGKLTDAEQKAVAKIRQLGGHAMELAQNDPHLEVSYPQSGITFTEEYLLPLKDLKPHLVHLNLRGLPVTDAQLVHLQDLTGLTRLHLEKTKITDKGLEHLKGLVNLEYLNLYGTDVTDAGLANLEGMKKLAQLYLWQTKVTDAGVAKLKQALPKVDVNRGFELPPPPKEEKKPDKPKAEKKPEEKKPEAKKEDKKPAEKPKEDKKPDEPKKPEAAPKPKEQDKK